MILSFNRLRLKWGGKGDTKTAVSDQSRFLSENSFFVVIQPKRVYHCY